MSATENTPSAETEQQPGRKFFMYGGAGMEQHSFGTIIKAMTKMFVEELGQTPQQAQENIKTYTSVMGGEMGKVNRFEDMAADLDQAFRGKQEVSIVVYSLGASEFLVALLKMLDARQKEMKHRVEVEHKDWEPLNLDHIQIILRSPSGIIENWKENLRQAKEFKNLIGGMKSGPSHDVESLIAVPPRTDNKYDLQIVIEAINKRHPEAFPNVKLKVNKVNTGIRQLMLGGRGQQRDFLADARFNPNDKNDNVDIRAELARLDRTLVAAAINVDTDSEAFDKALKARTDALDNATVLDQVFGNVKGLLNGPQWSAEAVVKNAWEGIKAFAKVIKQASSEGNIEVYRWLHSRGAHIAFIFPEHDVFAPLASLLKLLSIEKKYTPNGLPVDAAFLTTIDTHASITDATGAFIQAMRESFRAKEEFGLKYVSEAELTVQLPPIPSGWNRLTHFTDRNEAEGFTHGQNFDYQNKPLAETTDPFNDNRLIADITAAGGNDRFQQSGYDHNVALVDISNDEYLKRQGPNFKYQDIPNANIAGFIRVKEENGQKLFAFVPNPNYAPVETSLLPRYESRAPSPNIPPLQPAAP